jgi:hypothetical protein
VKSDQITNGVEKKDDDKVSLAAFIEQHSKLVTSLAAFIALTAFSPQLTFPTPSLRFPRLPCWARLFFFGSYGANCRERELSGDSKYFRTC